MDSAEHVFVHTGVEFATMDQIARAANVSKGSLYLYFKDKEDLYLSIAQRAVDDLVEREEEVQAQMAGRSGYEWLEAALRCYVDYSLEYSDRFRVAMNWLSAETTLDSSSPAYTEYQIAVGRAFQFGFEALELGKLDGSVRADLETSLSLFGIWGGIVGVLLMLSNPEEVRRRIPFQVDLRAAVDNNLQILLQSVRPAAVAVVEQSGLRMVALPRRADGS